MLEVIQGMFRRHEVVKQYLCLTSGCPEPNRGSKLGTLARHFMHHASNNFLFTFCFCSGIIDIPMFESRIGNTQAERVSRSTAYLAVFLQHLLG